MMILLLTGCEAETNDMTSSNSQQASLSSTSNVTTFRMGSYGTGQSPASTMINFSKPSTLESGHSYAVGQQSVLMGHASLTSRFNPSYTLTLKDIIGTQASTTCLIKVLPSYTPDDKFYINGFKGSLNIGENLWASTKVEGLYYVPEPNFDNAIPLRIEENIYLLVMEKEGDRIAMGKGPLIGIGSHIRFGNDEATTFLGNKYKGGGFTIKDKGIVFDVGTERYQGQTLFNFDGNDWKVEK
jgi:hypothetical protein